MAKHDDKKFNETIKAKFRDGFKEQFRNGLAQGCYAVCKVVLDKAGDESKPAEERLKDIVSFCTMFKRTNEEREAGAMEEKEHESPSPES